MAAAFSVAVETEWLLGPGQAPAGVAEAIGVSFRKLFRSTSKVRARSTGVRGRFRPARCTTPWHARPRTYSGCSTSGASRGVVIERADPAGGVPEHEFVRIR